MIHLLIYPHVLILIPKGFLGYANMDLILCLLPCVNPHSLWPHGVIERGTLHACFLVLILTAQGYCDSGQEFNNECHGLG